MESKLQRRIQRYGWDLAARDYELLWQAQLAGVQANLLSMVSPSPGARVLDVACGTGVVSFDAARAVGPSGHVLGIDLSGQMIDAARRRKAELALGNIEFVRMDAEAMDVLDASFDIAICALGLMYMPDPKQVLYEMRRILRPGGRLGLAVWGERTRCGWSGLFPIVDAEVASEVCPLFFQLGQQGTLVNLCTEAGFDVAEHRPLAVTLEYANADEACDAAFLGGPVALAWSRFDADVRARVRSRYLETLETWRQRERYSVPGEFVIVAATATGGS